MAANEPQSETTEDTEDTVQEAQDGKLLEDLDPEDEAAAGVQGGARRAGGRWPGARYGNL